MGHLQGMGYPQPYMGHLPGMGYPQPYMGHPAPNMGYPQPYMGHPAPNMGYPQPYMGHPAPNMGYPQPYMGHPAPNTGHPTMNHQLNNGILKHFKHTYNGSGNPAPFFKTFEYECGRQRAGKSANIRAFLVTDALTFYDLSGLDENSDWKHVRAAITCEFWDDKESIKESENYKFLMPEKAGCKIFIKRFKQAVRIARDTQARLSLGRLSPYDVAKVFKEKLPKAIQVKINEKLSLTDCRVEKDLEALYAEAIRQEEIMVENRVLMTGAAPETILRELYGLSQNQGERRIALVAHGHGGRKHGRSGRIRPREDEAPTRRKIPRIGNARDTCKCVLCRSTCGAASWRHCSQACRNCGGERHGFQECIPRVEQITCRVCHHNGHHSEVCAQILDAEEDHRDDREQGDRRGRQQTATDAITDHANETSTNFRQPTTSSG
jgi:hypothetical protein